MALQPDRGDEADDLDQQRQYLTDLINQESLELAELLELADAAPELPLQTPHEDNRDDFEDVSNLPQFRELVGYSMQHATNLAYVDPRLLHEQKSDQVLSPASRLTDPSRTNTSADDIFAFTNRQATLESARCQQPGEAGNLEAIDESAPPKGTSKRMRKCLKCRWEKLKVLRPEDVEFDRNTKSIGQCEHPTRYKAELLPAILTAYSMLFIAPESLKIMIDALYSLYENINALKVDFQGHLWADSNTVSLHLVLEDHSASAGLGDEHDVVLHPERLRHKLQFEAFKYPSVIEPAIDVIGFDRFISKKMWPGHEQRPGSTFTQAQENTLQTARLFCGYVVLLANLSRIEIYTEYTEQHTARLICVALVGFFSHRLCQLYQQLGSNLQYLVDIEESNHYVAARSLELVYRCLRAAIPMEWGTTNHPISQQLDYIRQLLNEWGAVIWVEIQDIERHFATPFRGDKRLKNDATMNAADNVRLPRHLKIYFETDRLPQSSTHMMLTRNGRLNMYTVPDLLSSKDIYNLPTPDKSSRDVIRPDRLSFNSSLPLDNDESSTGFSLTQSLQASQLRANHDFHPQSQTNLTNAATRPSTTTDADFSVGLFPIESHMWILGSSQRSPRLEGGTSNEALGYETHRDLI